jgi:hypothetical protein
MSPSVVQHFLAAIDPRARRKIASRAVYVDAALRKRLNLRVFAAESWGAVRARAKSQQSAKNLQTRGRETQESKSLVSLFR